MKKYILLIFDASLVMLATILSVIVRDNFDISHPRMLVLAPYLIATIVMSIFIISLFGVNRLVWRFSCLADYLRLVAAMTAISIASLAITFAFNRLDGVPRSLPFIQFNFSITLLVGLRVLYRLRYLARRSRRTSMTPLKIVMQPAADTVLLIGLSRLTETYLQSIAELTPGRIKIAGLLSPHKRHVGCLVAAHKVLGIPEDIDRVLTDLKVSGIAIDKIIVATPSRSLSAEAHKAITAAKRSNSIQLVYLFEKLGFETIGERPLPEAELSFRTSSNHPTAFEIHTGELKAMRERSYWRAKRMIDVCMALCLLIPMSPAMIFVALAICLSIGRPILFWQQRPGLGGRPFRLYKFRTMRPAHDQTGRELSDTERMSRMGGFLRRTRLDELPQLFNVLRGDMSFVGPRPLLPRDQDEAYRARLLVRPGLTGWAQVVGGRAISAQDKAALDVWYVRHASLILDLKVVLKTIPIVLFGETISRNLIETAWRDLRDAGILQNGIARLEGGAERAAA